MKDCFDKFTFWLTKSQHETNLGETANQQSVFVTWNYCKNASNISQLEAVREKPHRKPSWCVSWLQCHSQIMFQTGKLSQAETTTCKPFHMQGGKWKQECLMAFCTTVCYRLEWESRSSASQGAALQRRMATKLKCAASFCDRGWQFVSVIALSMWPQRLLRMMYGAASSSCRCFFI